MLYQAFHGGSKAVRDTSNERGAVANNMPSRPMTNSVHGERVALLPEEIRNTAMDTRTFFTGNYDPAFFTQLVSNNLNDITTRCRDFISRGIVQLNLYACSALVMLWTFAVNATVQVLAEVSMTATTTIVVIETVT